MVDLVVHLTVVVVDLMDNLIEVQVDLVEDLGGHLTEGQVEDLEAQEVEVMGTPIPMGVTVTKMTHHQEVMGIRVTHQKRKLPEGGQDKDLQG